MRTIPVSKEADSGPSTPARGAELPEQKVKSVRVMIVEDSAFMRKLIRGQLTAIGISQALEAADGLAALRAVNHFEPDVILLDWEMPIVDGRTFVHIFYASKAIKHKAPIIFLSAFAEQWRVSHAKTRGIESFLVKPVSALVLRDRITSLIRRQEAKEQKCDEDTVIVIN